MRGGWGLAGSWDRGRGKARVRWSVRELFEVPGPVRDVVRGGGDI